MKALAIPSPAILIRVLVPTTMRIIMTATFLLAAASVVQGETRTWTGASPTSSQWNYSSNWEGGQVPVNGDDVVFPDGAARLVNTNTYADRRFNSITISGGGYTIRGNSITVSNGITATYVMGLSELGLPITLGASQTIECSSVLAGLQMLGNMDLGGGTLTVQGAGSVSLDCTITGLGDLTKDGSGSLWLEGNHLNTFRGVTRVNSGRLHLNKNGTQAIGIGDLIIGDGVGTAESAEVWLRRDDQFGVVSVTINNDGWLNLYDFDDSVILLTFDGGTASSGTGTLSVANVITVTSNDGTISGQLNLTSPTPVFDVASGGNLQVEAAVSGANGFTKIGDGFLTLQGTNTYSGVATIQQGFVEVHTDTGLGSASDGTELQGGTLRLVSAAVAGEPLEASGGKLQAIGVASDWTGPLTLTNNVTINIPNAGQLLNLSGRISGGGGFTKTGAGTLILSGSVNNVYTGPTLVADGTLLMDKTSPYWAVGYGSLTVGDGAGAAGSALARESGNYQIGSVPITVNEDGLFDLNNCNDTVGNSLTLNEGGEVQTGVGTLSLGANSTITCSASSSTIHSSISGSLNLGTGICTFDISGGRLDIPAALRGSADILITAPTAFGGVYLSASNSFSGTLTMEDFCILWVDHAWALGDTPGNTVVNDSAYLGFGGGIHVAAESLTLNSDYSHGVFWVNGPEGGGSNSWSGPVTLLRETTVDFLSGPNYTFNFVGPISGPGGLTKKGEDGTLILSGSSGNTYTGDTHVKEGILELDKTSMDGAIPGQLVIGDGVGGTDVDVVRLKRSNQIANTADVTIASSGLFDLDGYYDRVDAVTGSGSVALGSGHLVAGNNSSSFTFDGVASGSGYLWKVGTGTWTLTGDNTYSGTTRIETGTLIVDGFQPGSDVLVQVAGVLGGVGTVGDINSQGAVAPGSSPGQLRSGNVVLSPASTFAVELDGHLLGSGYDQLNLKGTADVTGAILDVALGYLPAVGDSFVILNNDFIDPVTGTFAGLPDGDSLTVSNATLAIDYQGGNGNDVELTVTAVEAVEALRITSIEEAGSDVVLSWEGGVPFYVLERKMSLTNDTWLPATVPMRETQTNLPMDAAANFYRVKGSN